MSQPLRLVVFDVDGTLVDSQADIVAAMRQAFARAGIQAPSRSEILSKVGLALEVSVPQLAPALDSQIHDQLIAWYKEAYFDLREAAGSAQSSPFYPHVREVLAELHRQPETLLGVATGKSRRGLDKLLEGHALQHMFVTQQVGDHHPSKPHPSMVHSALSETGVDAKNAVLVGDTVFDMQMAKNGGIPFIGVDWGYHSASDLVDAVAILSDMRELPNALASLWELQT